MPTPGATYDPELVKLMGAALDLAWADVASITEVAPSADKSVLRELMAARILTGIDEGIRDPVELKTLALSAVDWYGLISENNPTAPPKKD
jgi:hypothetical protein